LFHIIWTTTDVASVARLILGRHNRPIPLRIGQLSKEGCATRITNCQSASGSVKPFASARSSCLREAILDAGRGQHRGMTLRPLPPSRQGEQATARQDQAGQSSPNLGPEPPASLQIGRRAR
jgi:hypothetical protein